ncbi:hypothetical protein MUN78_07135 [Leucobacter allii]|uniref:Uncharacterized protein n=1 Tax=Leucobacter allii TaxID=2932247 RepID=A0ABY4FQN6_9MICO|nr:hypothetical protein [Leucobacter allii]UOQ58591.1 hypothetical protein MUN78_07135 [Leucobacter allii]
MPLSAYASNSLGQFAADQFGTPTVTSLPDGRFTIEFDVYLGETTAWECIEIRREGDEILISDRNDGPVGIPTKFIGIVLECLATLAPEQLKS